MNERKQRIEALFEEALALTAPEPRAGHLDRACGDDAELRREVEELLRAAEHAGGFLAVKPGETAASPDQPQLTLQAEPALSEQPGEVIGRYKLLEKLGEGGFGVVYMAEQREPVRRKVALKIIKAGMDSRQVIARFEAERQALALMDHPNIAKILDGGVTARPVAAGISPAVEPGFPPGGVGVDISSAHGGLREKPGGKMPPSMASGTPAATVASGRPYFVMELVRGIKITDFCDQNQLSLHERLALFLQVCHAVQHAHQKGVIHRDLKPSNILVTINDGVPVPKVIDFGIAKATQQELTEKTLFTAFGQFMGTPAYMSPEQAVMTSLDIDTRSDIYSLGVLLYELLTGKPPFDTRELMKVGLDELCRTLREVEPPRPSTRLSTLAGEALASIAKFRKTDAPKLVHYMRGDLDWIVMKCLEKDRARRYETANGLAADLQRHLNNEPVTARAPSAGYRFGKFARRNKAALAVAATIAAVLVLATGVSLWQARLARQAQREANAKAKAERAAREESDAITKFLTGVFKSPDPARDGRTITVVETLDRAVKELDRDLTAQPARRAQMQAALGSTYRGIGLARQAIPLEEKVWDYHRTTSGPEHPDTLMAMNHLALSYHEAGRRDEAIKLKKETLARFRKVRGSTHRDTLMVMSELVHLYADADRRDEALKLGTEVVNLMRQVNGPEHPDTLTGIDNLAYAYYKAGRWDEAIKLQEGVLVLHRKVEGPERANTLRAMLNLANAYSQAERWVEARRLRREVLDLIRKVVGPEHPLTFRAMGSLADSYARSGQQEEALRLREEVLRLSRKVNGPEHPGTVAAMHNLAFSYDQTGREVDAFELQKEALALSRKVNGPEHPLTLSAMGSLADSYTRSGQQEEALRLREEVFRLSRKMDGPEHLGTVAAMHNLAMTYDKTGREVDVFELRKKALALSREVNGPEHKHTLLTMNSLAQAYGDAGHLDEDLKVREEMLAIARKSGASTNDPARLEQYMADVAGAYYRLGQYRSSALLYREQLQSRRSRPGAEKSATLVRSLSGLGRALSEWAWTERGTNGAAACEHAREGETRLREALAGYGRFADTPEWRTVDVQSRIGGALVVIAFTDPVLTPATRGTKLAEAEALLQQSHAALERDQKSEAKNRRDSLERLARLYQAWDEGDPSAGQAAKAAEWKQKLADFDKNSPITKPAGAEP